MAERSTEETKPGSSMTGNQLLLEDLANLRTLALARTAVSMIGFG